MFDISRVGSTPHKVERRLTHFLAAEEKAEEAGWARATSAPNGHVRQLSRHVEGAATLCLGKASHPAEPRGHPLTSLGASLPLNVPDVPELQVSPGQFGFYLGS